MITVSSKLPNNQITCEEEEIVLTGKPKLLKGYIQFQNHTDEQVFIHNLPLQKTKNLSISNTSKESININSLLAPQESRLHLTRLKMDPATPPGDYEADILIGGKVKKLKLIVRENLEIKLIPNRMTFFGISPGKVHNKRIQLHNHGNVPFTIPNVKHNTMIDMDLICRNLSKSIRETGDDGVEATLDHFVRGLKTDIADWVNIKIKEAGEVVQPGKSRFIHFSITLPEDVDKQKFYEGDVRFINKTIKYRILNDEGIQKK